MNIDQSVLTAESAPRLQRTGPLDMSWLGRCSASLLTLDLTDCAALDTQVG